MNLKGRVWNLDVYKFYPIDTIAHTRQLHFKLAGVLVVRLKSILRWVLRSDMDSYCIYKPRVLLAVILNF